MTVTIEKVFATLVLLLRFPQKLISLIKVRLKKKKKTTVKVKVGNILLRGPVKHWFEIWLFTLPNYF